MKHMRAISSIPHKAETVTTGSILDVLAQVITIMGTFITTKEASTRITDY
jgi:hypothetical protein